jgi:hypothetical protein
MTWNDLTSWLLTVVFVGTGAYGVVRLATPGPWAARVSQGTHVLMCAAMAAMPWAWAANVPAPLVISVFAVAGVWHLAMALYRPTALAGPGRPGLPGRVLLLAHAGMMFAMVWMAALMSYVTGGTSSGGVSMAGMSDMEMPGMAHDGSMPSMTMPMDHTGTTQHTMQHGGQPFWAHSLTAAFTTVFLAAACWFLLMATHRSRTAEGHQRRAGLGEGVAGGLMAAGMAASLVLMW